MFQITLKVLLRRWLACLILMLLICSGTFSMMLLGTIQGNQQEALEKLCDDHRISCTISNKRGTQVDELMISSEMINLCTKEMKKYNPTIKGSEIIKFYEWIEQVMLMRSVAWQGINTKENTEEENILTGITYTESVRALSPETGGKITFFKNETEEIFLTEEAVCIIPESMLETLTETEDGYELTMIAKVSNGTVMEEKNISLTVIGTYVGDSSTIYCPFHSMKLLFEEKKETADSMSFYVKDTRQLESFKEEAMKYFVKPDINAEVGYLENVSYGILFHDNLFQENKDTIEDNLAMLNFLTPILYILSAGVGFFASFLFIRGRMREFAVMRSMGCYRKQVIWLSFMEQLLLGIIGGCVGTLLFMAISTMNLIGFIGGVIFIGCYLLGVFVAIMWITNSNVMKLLKKGN